jgi:hypothetical protein
VEWLGVGERARLGRRRMSNLGQGGTSGEGVGWQQTKPFPRARPQRAEMALVERQHLTDGVTLRQDHDGGIG